MEAYPACARDFVELYIDRSGPCGRHLESDRGCVQSLHDVRPFHKMSRYLHKGLAHGIQNYDRNIWWVDYLGCHQKTHGDIYSTSDGYLHLLCHVRAFLTEH